MTSLRLTARQRQILQFVEHRVQRNGAPPTRAEIAEEFGFRSANAAQDHLRALARKGLIELVAGSARGIRLKRPPLGANQRERATSGKPAGERLHLPLIGRVAAGAPILAQQHISANYLVPASLFRQRPDYLLRVRGMSMRDAGIMDGDLLAVRSTPEARHGQIVVARLDDEVTVKRLWQQGSVVRLCAENPDFADILVPHGESFAIEGVAVGLVRRQLGE